MWESGVPAEFLGWVLVVSTVGGWCWPVRSRALVLCVACLGDLLSCAPSGELLTGPRGDLLSCAPSGELLMSPRAQGAGGGPPRWRRPPQDGVVLAGLARFLTCELQGEKWTDASGLGHGWSLLGILGTFEGPRPTGLHSGFLQTAVSLFQLVLINHEMISVNYLPSTKMCISSPFFPNCVFSFWGCFCAVASSP